MVLAVGAGTTAAGENHGSLEVSEDRQERWQERAAIMAADGGLPRAEAERLAWASLQAAEGRTGSHRDRDTG